MPDPKNYMVEGKYGLSAAAEQSNEAITNIGFYLEYFNPRAYAPARRWRDGVDNNYIENKDPKTNATFTNTFRDVNTAKKHAKKLKEVQKTVKNLMQHPTPQSEKMSGYIKLSEKLMDTEAGDYGIAVYDNPYLRYLSGMFINGPKVPQGMTYDQVMAELDDVDPVTHEHKGPLTYLNNFMSITADLYQREYERQAIEKDYTPEKEQEYLNRLKDDFGRMLENHKAFDKMVNADGTSKYDPYLQQKFDVMTYKNKEDSLSRRTCMYGIKNIEGQKQAIENGWGMNELGLLGSLSELKYTIDNNKTVLEKKCDHQLLLKRKQIAEERLADRNQALANKTRELEQEREKKARLEREHADAEEIRKSEEKIKTLTSDLVPIRERITQFTNILNNLPQEEAEANEKYRRIKEYSAKLDKLYDYSMNKGISSPLDKIEIADEYEKLAKDGLAMYENDKALRNMFNKSLTSVERSMEFAGRQPLPVDTHESPQIMDEKTISEYNSYYCVNSKTEIRMNMMQGVDIVDPYAFSSLNHALDEKVKSIEDDQELGIQTNEALRGPLNTQMAPLFVHKLSEDKEDRETMINTCRDQVKIYGNLFAHKMAGDKGADREMRRTASAVRQYAEIEKGEMLTAMIEQPVLFNFFTQVGNLNLYLDMVPSEKTKQWLQERNIFEPIQAFYDGGKELIAAEYDKQQMRKSGWDDKKEKLHLARLDECFSRMIKNFETLYDVDKPEITDDESVLANDLGHMTGRTIKSGDRPIVAEMVGLEWMKEGIKQGWNSKDLPLLFHIGTVEGYIKKDINKSLMEAEKLAGKINNDPKNEEERKAERERAKEEQQYRAKAEILKEFRDNELKNFKDSLLGKKISSPKDILIAATMIQGFYEKHKNHPLLCTNQDSKNGPQAPIGVFDSYLRASNETYIPRLINRCISEIKEAKEKGISLEKDNTKEFRYEDNAAEMKGILRRLRNSDGMSEDQQMFNTMSYMRLKFFDGMNRDAHPEYFDEKHPDYAISHNKLNKYLEEYSNHVLKACEPKSAKETADILEFGGHEGIMAEMRDKIKADASRGRLTAFITGRPERNKNDKSMEEAINGMKNAKAIAGTSNGLYDDIVKDLQALEKMKMKLSEELMEKYHTTNISKKIVGYDTKYDRVRKDYVEDKTKPFYEYSVPEDVKLDPKKIKKFTDKQRQVFERINHYLDNKNTVIREKGGNPENAADVSRLGRRGADRYKAMLDAKKALLNQNKAVIEFGNNGPSASERVMEKQKTLIPLGTDMADEKKRFAENVKYGIINANRTLENSITHVQKAENEIREKNGINVDNLSMDYKNARRSYDSDIADAKKNGQELSAEAKKVHEDKLKAIETQMKLFEDRIVESAERTLYSETIKSNFADKRNRMYSEVLAADRKEKTDAFKLKEKEFNEKKPGLDRELQRLTEYYRSFGREVPENEKNAIMQAENQFKADKKAYEDSMKVIDKAERDIALGIDSKYAMDKIPKDKLNEMNAGFANAVNDFVELKENGVSFKENSAQFAAFKQDVLGNAPFREEFRKRVLEEAKNGPIKTEDIARLRDDIIRVSVTKNYDNPAEVEKLTALKNGLGAKVDIAKAKELGPEFKKLAAKDLQQAKPEAKDMNKAPKGRALK